ncbi:MAG: hypothetical protein JNL62_05490 [Bryobacterales bacterium]|nr:hypothetical protein [Bryobacterales bacterium]
MRTRYVRPLLRLGAASLFVYAIAQTQSTAPDLSISGLGFYPPSPSRSLTATVSSSSANQSVNTSVAVYRGSVFAGGAVEIHRFAVSLTPFGAQYLSTPPMALTEGQIYSFCVDPDKAITEPNENNNCRTTSVSEGYTDLSVTTADISMTPVGANPGEPVRVNAIIRNERAVAGRALARIFQSHPESPNAKLMGQTAVHVPPSGSIAATWTFPRPAGDSNFFVVLDDVMPRDNSLPDNISSRNLFLKAIIHTGRYYLGYSLAATSPAIGDLLGTGQPVMVFGEHTGTIYYEEARVTAMQVFSDGTSKELWSKIMAPAPSKVLSPSMADLDGDGSPEIIVQIVRHLTGTSGEIRIVALDKTGAAKWTQTWQTVGRGPCANMNTKFTPLLGDMNKDKVADVVVLDNELVVLDGRNGAVLRRNANLPTNGANWCTSGYTYGTIADLEGDGSNEIIIGNYGIHVFNSDLTLRWRGEANNIYTFAIADTDKDGKPEFVLPVHRQRFDIIDGQTGTLKKRIVPPNWSPYSDTISVTSSLDPGALPTMAVANNDYSNGTGSLDNLLNIRWWTLTPLSTPGGENPSTVVLADLLGQGIPQVISRSDRRAVGIQDLRDGKWIHYFGVFGFPFMNTNPVPVDVDGDGRGEVIVTYGQGGGLGKFPDDPQYPSADFLIFGSDHWKKLPMTWNHNLFVPNQVDKKLAFRHDYQPWKSSNSWMQQPLRKPCDIDFDDDVDQSDVNQIFAAAGKPAAAGDPRDYDKDGTITVGDARACVLKCTSTNCAGTTQPPRLLSVGPRRAFPGTQVAVTIRGEFVNFKPGQTTASFGPGISVGGAPAGAMGPVTVIDFETATASLMIQPGQSGDRTVTVTTGAFTASREAAFSLSAGNLPPVVQAGPDKELILPGSISLSGTATDDGSPNPSLTVTWQAIGGPGTVTFSNPNSTATAVSFSKEGYYHLRLSAFDGQYVGSDDVGVRVILGNQPPYVSAGPDRSGPLDAALQLSGEVQDDGLPLGSSVSKQWMKVSGPGNVSLNPANAASTAATFSAVGSYVLRLTANDSQMSGSDEVTVTVHAPLPQILSVTPASAAPGQTRTVTIVTKNSKFITGSTQAHFGAGVSVGGAAAGTFGPVRVINELTAEADIAVASAVATGVRPVAIRTGAEQATKSDAFLIGQAGVPVSVRLNLSDTAVAPGGVITARPVALDAAGNVVSGPGQAFSMTVIPKPGQTYGNAPMINGLSVSFPVLAKRIINQNPVEDPTGEFADGDPADPNYAKETGGLYTLEVRLQGTAAAGSTTVVVLPSGTAEKTLRLATYANQLADALTAGRLAMQSRNATELEAARAQFGTMQANLDYSVRRFAVNNVLTPPNGMPVTIAQVAARFPAAPDDARFGQTVAAIVTHVRLVRQRIEAIQPATISQADSNALAAGVATYRSLITQLATLKPGPLGVTQHGDKLNELLRLEVPKLLDVISKKSLAILQAAGGTALKLEASRDAGSEFHDNVYAIFKDLAGYAKQNIVELVASLANDLINIAIANAINGASDGGLNIDFIAAGGSLSFVCPLWQGTYVEGSGFSSDIGMNDVTQIGCINSSALRSLVGLKKPKDFKSAQKLVDKIKKIAEGMELDKIVSFEQPDSMREGLFEGMQLVFNKGWDRVNRGRIPCVGIVIAFNLETGDFQAVNMNMLPECN